MLFLLLYILMYITITKFLILSGVEGSSPETEVELELHKCSAYEIVKLSRQKVEMENNPAYGEIETFSYSQFH